jgi:hypothetical protein
MTYQAPEVFGYFRMKMGLSGDPVPGISEVVRGKS